MIYSSCIQSLKWIACQVKRECNMTGGDRKKISNHQEYEKPWTFITNHAAVLSLLAKYPRITAREVAQEVGYNGTQSPADHQ